MKRLFPLAALLAGCTAGTALKDYPRRVIDRPYTLPEGVAAWSTGAEVTRGSDETQSATFLQIPLLWDLALSNDWNLLLGDSFGVAHQFLDDGHQRIGAALSIRPAISSDAGFLFAPSLRFDHRVRLWQRWAWNSALFGNASRWTGRPRWSWGVGVGTGPLFQATETFALGISLDFFFARSYLVLPGDPLSSSGRGETSASIAASWSLGRQWDLGASIGYLRTENANGYRALFGGLTVANLW